MKIVCESCGAKYSIADDRVVGKMFKIRCKRCSEVIVVRGDQQQAAPAASAAAAGGEASWHVVVEGEQAGPYTPQQLQEMLGRGAIDWEAYVWTEGFDNWVAMREVDALVTQLGGPRARAAQPEAAAGLRGRPGGDTLVGQPSMGADPFADDPAPAAAAEPFASPARTPAPDLFGRTGNSMPAPAYRDGDQGVMVAAAPNPRAPAERAMTGARNENSVLFSLKNLQALATGSGSGSPPPAAAPAGERGGYASGEGSGLIDIRALATATGVNETGGTPARDDLLAMGTQGGAFGALGSPMLSPKSEEGDSTKKMIVWGAVASVALLSLSAIVIIYMVRNPSDAPGRAIVEPPAVSQQHVEPAAPVAAAPTPAPGERPAPVNAEPPAQDDPDKTASSEREPSRGASAEQHQRRRPDAREPAVAKAPSQGDSKTMPAEVAAPKKPRKEGPQTLDELLDGALGSQGGKARPAEAAEPAANLADTPTREQVLTAMSSVKPAVQECSQGAGVVATVTVNVAGATGHVTNAQVTGVTGPVGSCIAQAVRKASFPRFQQKVFKVTFPYKL